MITVRAIGAAEVRIGRKRITQSTEMVLAVAVYLCVRAGDRMTRDEVVDVFWPGSDLAKGRHSLRQMLYKLRLKGFTLDEDDESLQIDRERVDCDATRALDESWPETAEPWMIEDSGEFLPVVTRTISPQFQEWLDSTRSRLASQYRRAALRQVAQARREGRWADLERWGRVVLRTDPLNEEATLARAESAAMAGSKAMALEILDQYVEELGERAGQIALPATVLRRRISERKPEWGGRAVQEVPLVGREALMRRLTTYLLIAGQGHGDAILLYGAPGIGKTRLSNEVREFAQLSGFQSCTVRATQSDTSRPLSLAIAIASAVQDLPGAAGTSPTALRLLSRLCGPLAHSREHDVGGVETISPAEAAWALADACAAAANERRLLLHIDDLHNADDLSLQVIATLAHSARSHRLLILATSRLTSHHAPHVPKQSLPAFTAIPVPPLSRGDSMLLVSAFAASPHRPLTSHASSEITRAGGGNPLFLRELTSQRVSQQPVDSVPQSLVEVIEQRIRNLSLNELRLLRLISLLGPLARFSRIRALLPATAWDYDAFLEQQELEGVLSMTSSACLELHECWHDSISDAFTGTALSAMSLDAAVLLSSETSTDASISNYWRAAELFAVAGSYEHSRAQFRRVAELFTSRGLPRQATEALSQAVALGGDIGGRMELLSQLARAQNTASLYSDAVTSCCAALACAPDATPESATIRTQILTTLVDSRLKLGLRIDGAIDELALTVTSTDIPDSVCQLACHVALRSLFNAGAGGPASLFLKVSLRSTAQSGRSLLGSIVRLMYAAERGSADELSALEREVAEGVGAGDAPSTRMLALRYRATALRFLGRPGAAAETMEQAIETANVFGAQRDARLAAAGLIFLHLDHANYTEAQLWLTKAEQMAGPAHGIDVDYSLMHAKARYFVETGDARACLATYGAHIDTIQADTAPRRSASDRACLALAFIGIGEIASARASCDGAIELLDALQPGLSEDWIANSALRCLNALGATDEASKVHDSYLLRRASTFDRPIPVGFTELARARRGSTSIEAG